MQPEIQHSGITVIYRREDASFVGESEQLPSLFAEGDTFEEARALASRAVRDICGEAPSILHMRRD